MMHYPQIVIPKSKLAYLIKEGVLLIKGNNVIEDLENIPLPEPISYSYDTKDLDISDKVEELRKNVKKAAVQLKHHYNKIADEDEEFAPYWNQFRSLGKRIDDFPSFGRMRSWQSKSDYMKKMRVEERIRYDRLLHHFDPFFDYHDVGDLGEELNKIFSKYPRHGLHRFLKNCGRNILIGGGVGALIGAMPYYGLEEILGVAGMFSLMGIGFGIMGGVDNNAINDRHYTIQDMILRQENRAYIANRAINWVHEYSKDLE